MSDTPILHHYAGSPFAEKTRLILGFKALAWQSVIIPTVMPKPDLTALTGGYRKTPVLQIGADIYCDTALIARVLERLQPTPTLYPAEAPLAPLLAQWADSTLFWTAVPYALQPAGAAAIFAGVPPEAMKAFAADRAGFSTGAPRVRPTEGAVQLRSYFAQLEAQLADGRRHLFGEGATIADFSVAHCLWFIRLAAPLAGILSPYARLSAWLDRMLALGHGPMTRFDSTQAIAVAAAAPGHAATQVVAGLGHEAGSVVHVSAIDYGTDPVAGTLVGLSADEVVIERNDDRAGRVHVHFPRIGFQIKQEKT